MRGDPFREPASIAERLSGVTVPWWVAGGWAIDLRIGQVTRHHGDVDICVLRRDQHVLRARLADDWRLRFIAPAKPPIIAEWRGEQLESPIHQIIAERDGVEVEFLLEDASEVDWIYRRDHRVRMPLSAIGRMTASGIPTLIPAIVLLYKAKATRDRDIEDLQATLPLLSGEHLSWLRSAVAAAHPASRYTELLMTGRSTPATISSLAISQDASRGRSLRDRRL